MAVIGIVTGQFDIIHPGYISLFQFAKRYCDKLHVLLNRQPDNKEPPIFRDHEREIILDNLLDSDYDEVITYGRYITLTDAEQPYKSSEEHLYSILKDYERKQAENFNIIRFLGEEYKDKDFTGKDLNIPVIYHPNQNQWHYTQVLEKAHEKFLRIKEKDTK